MKGRNDRSCANGINAAIAGRGLFAVTDARAHPPFFPAHFPPTRAAPSRTHDQAPASSVSLDGQEYSGAVLYAVAPGATSQSIVAPQGPTCPVIEHGRILILLWFSGRRGGQSSMRFHLIDRIDAWEPGKSLRASKFLALGEEYLADHFPRFPIMPGVLMLQACVEAAAWLWRTTTDFRHPVIVLREVKTVKYGTFMQPGRRMDVSVELTRADDSFASFKCRGANDAGEQTVATQFTLHGYDLTARGPAGAAADARLLDHWKDRWELLTGRLRASA
jgi:3-hydroxyacyl-[acyl-carrier-protein] dehydratase